MDIFKMKVIIDNTQIELEGDSSTVYKIFQELKECGLGELSPLAKKNMNDTTTDDVQTTSIVQDGDLVKEKTIYEEKSTNEPLELPTLQTVVLQGKPSTEQEWILVYAVYCSQLGTTPFTAEDLRLKYQETNRFSLSKNKNFQTNVKKLVSSGFISAIDNTKFKLENLGLEKAKKIILNEKIKKNNSSLKNKKNTTSYQILELNLSEKNRNDLRDFWNSHKHSTSMDKAVLVAYWLKKEKAIENYTADHLFTILRTIDENASFDILSALKNSQHRKNHFIYDRDSNSFKLHHIGEDYVKILENKDINNNE
ncbi:hypothetical protein HB948_03355 [Listeria welshimeri]|nr:hypothetical protein [Listeria welshimeri]